MWLWRVESCVVLISGRPGGTIRFLRCGPVKPNLTRAAELHVIVHDPSRVKSEESLRTDAAALDYADGKHPNTGTCEFHNERVSPVLPSETIYSQRQYQVSHEYQIT